MSLKFKTVMFSKMKGITCLSLIESINYRLNRCTVLETEFQGGCGFRNLNRINRLASKTAETYPVRKGNDCGFGENADPRQPPRRPS
jgi:hypothetical protein